jgi:hypothetical protein
MDDHVGQCGWIGRKAGPQGGDVGELGDREIGSEQHGQFGFTAALMGEGQQIDHQAARRFLGDFLKQPVKGQAIGIARK